MNYAYLDKDETLRITSSEATARQYAKLSGKVIATEIPAKGGVPLVRGRQAYVIGIGRAYGSTNTITSNELELKSYPELLDAFVLWRDAH